MFSETRSDDAQVFDLNNQPFFDIFDEPLGAGGNVLIEYKKVPCSNWNANAEVYASTPQCLCKTETCIDADDDAYVI